jgi:hypothetical protein
VSLKPHFKHVRSFFGEIAATLPVEGVWVDADMLLEPDFAVTIFIACMGLTRIRRSAIVCVLHSIVTV